MDLSIVLVNYNTTDHLRDCLKSIFRHTHEIIYEVIVVDNNSPEREIEKLPTDFPEIKFLFRNVNDGFGGGCNFGASKADGKYLLFVNPDVLFESNVPKIMYEFMKKNPEAAACSPVFTNFQRELVYTYNKFPNFKWEFFEFLGMGNDRQNKKLLENRKITENSPEPLFVDWATGACLMVPSALFSEVQGFDEDYFLYYEDTDLQYRISSPGNKVAVIPYLKVKHFVNSSVKSSEGEKVYYYHLNRSKMLYFYKHFGFLKRNALRSLIVTGILLRIITLNFRKRYRESKAQKMDQYKKMLGIYLSAKRTIFNSENEI